MNLYFEIFILCLLFRYACVSVPLGITFVWIVSLYNIWLKILMDRIYILVKVLPVII
jgi:hypothetical protein